MAPKYCPLTGTNKNGVSIFGFCLEKQCAWYETGEDEAAHFKPKCSIRGLIPLSEDLFKIKEILRNSDRI
jgi:hypothetical protein